MNILLKSYPIAIDTLSDDNHIYIQTVADDKDYSIGINVCSNVEPHLMQYVLKEYEETDFKEDSQEHKLFKLFHQRKEGQYTVRSNSGPRIDYQSQQWFAEEEMKTATRQKDANNQLGQAIVDLINRAMEEPEAYIVAFGRAWGPYKEADRTFGFTPARGLHDVHCNRWNGYGKRKASEEYLDGAMFVWLPSKGRFTGVFCQFFGQ